MKLRKISFINSLMHTRDNCECRNVLVAAENSLQYSGLLQEVKEYCEEYSLPDVSQVQLLKKDIDNTVKRKSVTSGWLSLLSSSKVLMRWQPKKTSEWGYFKFNRLESKLMLALQIGELNFLTNRRRESLKEKGSTACYTQVCGGEDSLDHVSVCFGYDSKPPAT